MIMENLEAISSQLGKIATAFKDGGLFFLIGVIVFLAYLVLMALIKRRRQSTQSVNVNVGQGDTPAPATGPCPLHSGIEAQIESLEGFRKENREDHQKLFDQISKVSVAIGPLTPKF